MFTCLMCTEQFNDKSKISLHRKYYFCLFFVFGFYSTQAYTGGFFGFSKRNEFFSGKCSTWKRLEEMWNERKERPSIEERTTTIKNTGFLYFFIYFNVLLYLQCLL